MEANRVDRFAASQFAREIEVARGVRQGCRFLPPSPHPFGLNPHQNANLERVLPMERGRAAFSQALEPA